MKRSGAFGVNFAAGGLLVVLAFVGCGGSSKTNRNGDDDEAGNGGTNTSGSGGSAARGGSATSGGASGTSAGGAAFGGSFGGVEPRGGTGAATPIPPPGPSYCGGQPCDPPRACCLSSGKCFDPGDVEACSPPPTDGDPEGRIPCSSSAQCEVGEFCMLDGLLCVGTGHCQPIGNCGFCESGDPGGCRVCACDGNTYPDFQTACLAGVNTVSTHGAACGETGMEGGAGSSSIGPREYTVCGNDTNCPAGSFCCALVSRCYVEADRDICVRPPDGTRIACNTTANCGDNEYCQGEGGCDGPGGCVYMGSGPGDCGVTLEPVCGCDGTTYTSAACADQEGVRVDHDGECAGK